MAIRSPLGPGFFIFFQRKEPQDGKTRLTEYIPETKTHRIKQDDEEVLLLMEVILSRR